MLFKLPQRQRVEQTVEGQREIQLTIGDRVWVRRADGKVSQGAAGEPTRALTHLLVPVNRRAADLLAEWRSRGIRDDVSHVGRVGGRPVTESEPADLLVNCTSVGLGADQTFKDLPIAADDIVDYCALIDLVYTESATALARAATSHGLKTVDGLEVLVHQGALSLEQWTGRTAPIETMRRAARRPSPR